ncbi:MAG TPA: hypothetical protein VNV17_24105, partial [Solirubrobacteraceae bacterium]|nr:hypothetical protein [Solirubrobacteraceae bacterium]
MRATRAYLAGLGTAGTLVLAASILFVLGSAVISYNGWPKLGGIGSPATQTLTAHPKTGSHTSSSSSHGLAAVSLVKPDAATSGGLPALVAAKRSTLLAQVGHSSVGRPSARHSDSGTISHPVAGRQPTRGSTPTRTGSGSGSGSGSGTTGTGTGTITAPIPVVVIPTPIASTPTTPVSTGSGSSGSGGSGSSGGPSGSGSGSGGSG